MEQISIVRKRSRVWPIVIALIIVALVVAAAVWFLGDATNMNDLDPALGSWQTPPSFIAPATDSVRS